MTRGDDFIQRLEDYLDEFEGLTPLPGPVRDSVRAALPEMKQARPLSGLARYMPMNLKGPAQFALAAAAAILIVAGGVFILGGQNIGGPGEPSSSPEPSAPSEPSPAACETDLSYESGQIDIAWCAPTGPAETERLSFAMDGPDSWIDEYFPDRNLWVRPADGGAITFSLQTDFTAEAWLDEVSNREGYLMENRADVTIGGSPAVVVDVRLSPGTSSGAAPRLLEDVSAGWSLSEESSTRMWVLDRDGRAFVVVTGEELADDVAGAMETFTWRD